MHTSVQVRHTTASVYFSYFYTIFEENAKIVDRGCERESDESGKASLCLMSYFSFWNKGTSNNFWLFSLEAAIGSLKSFKLENILSDSKVYGQLYRERPLTTSIQSDG